MKQQPPKVEIKTIQLTDNVYCYNGDTWDVPTLIQAYKEQKCIEFDMPLAGVCLENMPFDVNRLSQFLYQVQRVNNTDLKYPIIITDEGYIADGWHRVCKAILQGKSTIKAVRLKEMPKASGKETISSKNET